MTKMLYTYLREHWLTVIVLILTMGIAGWTYVGFTNLTNEFDGLKTPAIINIPTLTPAIITPTNASSDVVEDNSTPAPENAPPRVPSVIREILGDKLYPVLLEGQGWHLANLSGILYYSWDEELEEWLALPRTKEQYCVFPIASYRELEPWDSICYLDFSGLGISLDPGLQSDVVINKDAQGTISITEQGQTLYVLSSDPLLGYRWVEFREGFIKRIITATALISEIDPQPLIEYIELPNYILNEYRSTETTFSASYLGSVDHEILNELGESLGSVRLHLFARNRNVLFWISGEGQILGIRTGVPFLTRYVQSRIETIYFLLDSTEALIPGRSYELVFFASQYVDPKNDGNQVLLSRSVDLSYVINTLTYNETWIIKQLVLMCHSLRLGEEWITDYQGELEASPPSIVPYFYIKSP